MNNNIISRIKFSSFCTAKLVKINESKYAYITTWKAIFFTIMIGFFFICSTLYYANSSNSMIIPSNSDEMIIWRKVYFFAVLITVLIILIYYKKKRYCIFDLQNKFVKIYNYKLLHIISSKKYKLTDIKSIKLKHFIDKDPSCGEFNIYQISLLLQKKYEVILVTHGNINQIMTDLSTLSKILNCKIEFSEIPRNNTFFTPGCSQEKRNLFLYVVMSLSFIFLSFYSLSNEINYLISTIKCNSWHKTHAIISENSILINQFDKTKLLMVRYKYIYLGKEYSSSNYHFYFSNNWVQFDSRLLNKIKSNANAGSATTCFVNPTNPYQAVVNRDLAVINVFFSFLFSSFFLYIGLRIMFCIIIRRKTSSVAYKHITNPV